MMVVSTYSPSFINLASELLNSSRESFLGNWIEIGQEAEKTEKKERSRQTDRQIDGKARQRRRGNQTNLSEYIQFDWIKLKGKTS